MGEENIIQAPSRAIRFVKSKEFGILKKELDDKVEKYRDQILIASLIDNVNVRGRVIEYLITGEDEEHANNRANTRIHRHTTMKTSHAPE